MEFRQRKSILFSLTALVFKLSFGLGLENAPFILEQVSSGLFDSSLIQEGEAHFEVQCASKCIAEGACNAYDFTTNDGTCKLASMISLEEPRPAPGSPGTMVEFQSFLKKLTY